MNFIESVPSIIPNATAKDTTTPVSQPIKLKNLVEKLFFAIYIFSIGVIPISSKDFPKTCLNEINKFILNDCFSEPITGQE